MWFSFKCCSEDQTLKPKYQITTKQGNRSLISYATTPQELKNKSGQILRITPSQYNQLAHKYSATNKWSDPTFPPNSASLGNIDGVPANCPWKRISDIVQNPQIYALDFAKPVDVVHGQLSACYFLGALSALVEAGFDVSQGFGQQAYHPGGVYKVVMRIDGIVQEIIVDDYVPVNASGLPLFSQPNKNYIWVLLLEKAWAKANGSYENICRGTPTNVFKAITYAPSQVRPVRSQPQSVDKMWRDLCKSVRYKHPACLGTVKDRNLEWESKGLEADRIYTLINTIQIGELGNEPYRVLKIRNPWVSNVLKGPAHENDHDFWSRIPDSPEKSTFLAPSAFGNQGIFTMLYQDFCRFFNDVHFCNLIPNAVYESESVLNATGAVYQFRVEKTPGHYTIELHQQMFRGQKDPRRVQGYNRSTLILANANTYQYVQGSLKYYQQQNRMIAYLIPGQYCLYTRIDKSAQADQLPGSMCISIFSNSMVGLKPAIKDTSDFLKKVFICYARKNRRKLFQNGLMWASWKILFWETGFAYIVFGVDAKCEKKFLVSPKEIDFEALGYELESPIDFSCVKPGEQKIILARVKNGPVQTKRFPPNFEISIEKA